MTTAKPKHMAGQTDSADDLIAELARLMAEDAQVDKPKIAPATPVRIPGGDVPVAVAPAKEAQAQSRPVRIPGDNAPPAREPRFEADHNPRPSSTEPKTATPQRSELGFVPPFAAPRQAAPAPVAGQGLNPEPAVAPKPPAQAIPIAVQDVAAPSATPAPEPVVEMPALDQDSLADLIAAELSVAPEAEQTPQTTPDEPVVELDVTSEVAAAQQFPSEVDSFGVPPVFGLAPTAVSKPEPKPAPVENAVAEPIEPAVAFPEASPQPEAFVPPPPHRVENRPDPLEEIERLIGPAARVHQAPPPPSPALRSLATPTLPREPEPVSASKAQTGPLSSIEEAILAAAATSGAKVEWVEPAIAARLPDDEPVKKNRAPRGQVLGMTRSLAGPVVATLLLAVAAVGLYTVLGLGSSTPDGPAPLVAADTTPTKEVPEPAPDSAESNQSVVFNEIAGVNTGADEQIVSRDQADVEAVTQVASSDLNEEGLVNRKVRTVTVRPDGTIVSGGDSVAGSAMLPVDRPSVPDVPGADFSTPDLIANAATTPATALPETPQAAVTPQVTPVQPGSTVSVVDLAGNPVSGKTAPVPLVRPSSFAPQAVSTTPAAQQLAPATQEPVATLPAATPAPSQPQTAAVAPSGNSAPAYVQLSSQRSEEAARQSAQDIASRFGPLFGGANLEVQRVDLGERGIFYRVRVPADSIQSANAMCSSVKASGGDCYTL